MQQSDPRLRLAFRDKIPNDALDDEGGTVGNDDGRCVIFLEDALFQAAPICATSAQRDLTGPCGGEVPVALSDAQLHDLRTFVPFSMLHDPPTDVDKPKRFHSWVQAGGNKISPCPGATLLLTSDGSYSEQRQAGSWGLVIGRPMLTEAAGSLCWLCDVTAT